MNHCAMLLQHASHPAGPGVFIPLLQIIEPSTPINQSTIVTADSMGLMGFHVFFNSSNDNVLHLNVFIFVYVIAV